MTEPFDRIIADLLGYLEGQAGDIILSQVDRHSKKLGSPIELLFLQSWIALHLKIEWKIPAIDDAPGFGSYPIKLQQQIGPYRVDFLIEVRGIKIVVECDGHDFHEKTKEQAASDRQRDRYLVGRGYVVLRFTGSELYRNPSACADEVHTQIIDAECREWQRTANG